MNCKMNLTKFELKKIIQNVDMLKCNKKKKKKMMTSKQEVNK